MSSTSNDAETSPSDDEPTLAERLEASDEHELTDAPPCPHPHCHGTLSAEDGVAICQTCRCDRSGYFYPPRESGHRTAIGESVGNGSPSSGETCPVAWAVGPWDGDVGPDGQAYETYANGAVRLCGGFEAVYDEDDSVRPDSVTDAYTFDLSTL